MRRLTATLLAFAFALAAAPRLHAQQISPRDVWPQAANAAREGDFDGADKRAAEMLTLGRSSGIRTFPTYAASAAGLAYQSAKSNPQLASWAARTANQLDPRSPTVAFSESDRAASAGDWGTAARLAFQGLLRVARDYRASILGRSDLMIVAIIAIAATAFIFAVALFFRYARSMAHDFREVLGIWFHGGSVTVLAFALLFLPIFFWLGPMWLIFYWFAIFFGYAGVAERIAIVVLLLMVAILPLALETTANRIAGVDGPLLNAVISSNDQSYQPETLRRMQDLLTAVPDHPMLQLVMGNLQTFEGADDQAGVHYRRAIELRSNYAGAHVNLGNLHFLNNEFQAAITEYERAEKADPELAIAYYNHSVAAGETYKFDLQAKMLESARAISRSQVERYTRNPPPQKIVMYHPPIKEAWEVTSELASRPDVRAQFGTYSKLNVAGAFVNPVTIGAILSLLIAIVLAGWRRRSGLADSCIKCGRTFCHRCKSARESATYCTQCIHIYLKRDGVSLDTKRQKLEEVSEYHAALQKRNRLFATFLPGSAQILEGRTASGILYVFVFSLLVATAIFVGRLAPMMGPVAETAQMIVRVLAIVLAVVVWIMVSVPVYRRRAIA